MSDTKKSTKYQAVNGLEHEVVDGGVRAWTTLFGAWLVLFATVGYVYSFGVYQVSTKPLKDFYTRFYLSEHSPSKIAWIGSLQIMMPFACGIVSGKLFDAGYFHALQIAGAVIFSASLFLLSLAKPQAYFEIFLSQGVGMGLGMGFAFVPSLSITGHYFKRRKAFATGIAMTGISLGAVVFPIMINNLIGEIGFAKTVRATGYIVLGFLIIGNCLMRTAYNKHADIPKLDIKSFFTDPPYMLTVLGGLISLFGLYFPLFYLQLYSVVHGIDPKLAFYSIAILNASSTVGRIMINFTVDIYGAFNVLIPTSLITGASIFAVFAVKSSGSLIAVSIFYGFFSGAWLSVAVASLASLARHPNEVGARTGLALAMASFGLLGAAPVQGSLLTSEFLWSKPMIFSGVCMATPTLLFIGTRTLLAKERSTSKV
ncbi:hypothetical protein GALMADRAFT_141116 [Galerina marginata CBS 339.88]|uniref:Major facilitator superfamily (MFS) profile domain-containing protein n=1 Tax=Galerina marginata (strain CBS 339.88) TaxID=685588 RepID=A0A067T4A8_GALM3|nr:hypothetical protein GALMADRAFT_141116 [Galerina marginata CBS 339.88]